MYAESTVIYADVLFAINFSMDFICLFITGRLLNRREKSLMLLCASAAGALYGFLPYCLPLSPILSLVANLISAGILCFIAFGIQSPKPFALTTVTFMVTSALLGGMVTAIYNLAGDYHNSTYREISAPSFALICILSALTALAYGIICRKKIHTASAEISISIGNKNIRARLIADSGNLVTEPFSALPVIILSSSALPKPYDDPESKLFPLAVRAIPFSTAAGSNCFFGFRPDKIEILRLGKKPKAVEAYIAVDTLGNNFSGYDGILPTSIL